MKTGNVVLSILLAATAGVAAGLLLAPDKGKRTQRRIREKGEDLLDDLSHQYDRTKDQLKRRIDFGQETEHAQAHPRKTAF